MKSIPHLLSLGMCSLILLCACTNANSLQPAPTVSPRVPTPLPSVFQWEVLRSLQDDKPPVAILTAAEIETYNWTQQTITLTTAATQQLLEELLQQEDETFRQSCEAGYLAMCLMTKAFVITFEDEQLYAGGFQLAGGAARVEGRVIYVDINREQGVFFLLPPPWRNRDPESAKQLLAPIAQNTKLHDYFLALGKLVE